MDDLSFEFTTLPQGFSLPMGTIMVTALAGSDGGIVLVISKINERRIPYVGSYRLMPDTDLEEIGGEIVYDQRRVIEMHTREIHSYFRNDPYTHSRYLGIKMPQPPIIFRKDGGVERWESILPSDKCAEFVVRYVRLNPNNLREKIGVREIRISSQDFRKWSPGCEF